MHGYLIVEDVAIIWTTDFFYVHLSIIQRILQSSVAGRDQMAEGMNANSQMKFVDEITGI